MNVETMLRSPHQRSYAWWKSPSPTGPPYPYGVVTSWRSEPGIARTMQAMTTPSSSSSTGSPGSSTQLASTYARRR